MTMNKDLHALIVSIQKSDWSARVIKESIETAKELGADTDFLDALRNLRPWCE